MIALAVQIAFGLLSGFLWFVLVGCFVFHVPLLVLQCAAIQRMSRTAILGQYSAAVEDEAAADTSSALAATSGPWIELQSAEQ